MRKHILMKATMAMILILSTLPALLAQEAFVVYLEGVVEYRDGTRWVDSFIGDSFPVGTEVRIGNGGFLEVVAGDRTIRYTESGTYRIHAAEATRNRETGSTDLGGLIRGTVSRFARTAAISATRRNSVAAGVRGSEAAQEPSIEWAGDDSPMELVLAGIEALNDGEIEEASFLFEDAYSIAQGAVQNEAGFFFVYTLYLLDERELALNVLSELEPEPAEPYYPDYALVAAEILLDAGNPKQAADLLRASIDSSNSIFATQILTAQATYFLLGRAVEALNKPEAARYFARAAEIAPTTAIGRDAATR